MDLSGSSLIAVDCIGSISSPIAVELLWVLASFRRLMAKDKVELKAAVDTLRFEDGKEL